MSYWRKQAMRVKVAWIGLLLSLIMWPVSQFTFASSEPPVVLALSWLAICLVCVDIVINTKTLSKDDDDSSSA